MSGRLTARSVDAAIPDPKHRKEIPDAAMPGLYLVVQPSGVKSWAVRYRYGGKSRKFTIGRYPAFSLADARKQAREATQRVDLGVDPLSERNQRREPSRNTISALVDQFDQRHLSQLKSGPEVRRHLDRFFVARWGSRDIASITKRDLLDLLDEIVDSGRATTANRVLAYIRKFFNWAIERDVIELSPAQGIKPPRKEQSRNRVLSKAEIVDFWVACDVVGYPWGHMAKVLLLTGQRLGEVVGMSDGEVSGRVWSLPSERTKNTRPHSVHLSDPVLSVLNSIPRLAGSDLYFTTTGTTGVSGYSKAIKRLRNAMEDHTPAFGFHDLRRTAATGMARQGCPVQVVEAVLNHASGALSGIAGVYNRYDYAKEKENALDDWAAHVTEIVG